MPGRRRGRRWAAAPLVTALALLGGCGGSADPAAAGAPAGGAAASAPSLASPRSEAAAPPSPVDPTATESATGAPEPTAPEPAVLKPPTVPREEDLFVGNPVVTPVDGGQEATLTVRTKRKLACRVLYGTDANVAEGSVAERPAGARLAHRIAISGLAARTQYFYRVQGTDAQGKKHFSKVLSFYTAGPEGLRTPGRNVAVGAKVTAVSSQLSIISRGANAVDGDQQTEWVSNGDGDDAAITIDLGRTVKLAGVGFRTRSLGDGTAVIRSVTVMGDDGKVHGPYRLGMGVTVIDLALTTRTLRFEAVETTGGNTGAIEIEAYEAPKGKKD